MPAGVAEEEEGRPTRADPPLLRPAGRPSLVDARPDPCILGLVRGPCIAQRRRSTERAMRRRAQHRESTGPTLHGVEVLRPLGLLPGQGPGLRGRGRHARTFTARSSSGASKETGPEAPSSTYATRSASVSTSSAGERVTPGVATRRAPGIPSG